MSNYSNPVGSLQERFQSHGMKPHYKLVKASGSAHDPTFSCQVTVRNLVCLGSGSSKKQAKNTAALAMLDKLDKMRKDEVVPDNKKISNMMVPAVVLANAKSQARPDHVFLDKEKITSMPNTESPATDKFKGRQNFMVQANEDDLAKNLSSGNSVGTLHELCAKLGYRQPEYDLEGLDGQPQVGISILCSVGDLQQRGVGPCKDEAKMEAAQKMVDLLRSLMPKSLSGFPSSGKTQQDDVSNKMDSLNIESSKMVNNGSSVVNTMDSKMVKSASACSKIVNSVSGEMNNLSSLTLNSVSSGTKKMSSKKVSTVSSSYKKVNCNTESREIVERLDNQLIPFASAKLDGLHKTCLKEKTGNYITMLKELGKEQKFVVTHVEERSEDNIQCLVQLSTVPVAVSYAIGTDSETIHNEAARDILIYLKMLTKRSENE